MSSNGNISKKLESISTKTKILAVYYFPAENHVFKKLITAIFLALYISFNLTLFWYFDM